MSEAQVKLSIQKFDNVISDYKIAFEDTLNLHDATLAKQVKAIENLQGYNLAVIDSQLIPYITHVYFRAIYYSLANYRHYSPQLFAIMSGLWTVIMIVWRAVQFLIDIHAIKILLTIIEVL